MSVFVSSADLTPVQDADGLDATQLMTTNWQTTAAVGLTVASGGVAGAIMLAAFPAQTLGATAAIGTLAYAGKNRAGWQVCLPFMDKQEDKSSASKDEATA